MSDLIGRTIDNKYVVVDLIGEGGFGEVYSAKRIEDNEIVALKVIYYPDYTEHCRRFSREVEIMESIDHENVIKILDYNLEDSPPYIVMPLAKYSLADIIDKLKSDESNTLKIFIHACKGIKKLHESEICHRDIKPANILISQDAIVLISDLGLGKIKYSNTLTLTESGEFIGTDLFRPPEYYSHQGSIKGDERGDIYQLGKTLCNLLTGQNPTPLTVDIVSSPLQFIILRATANEPNERYQSVDELIDAIKNYLGMLVGNNPPEDVFDFCLEEINKHSPNASYDPTTIEKMLQSLYATKDSIELFLNLFDKIPLKLLEILSHDMNYTFKLIIQEYAKIMKELANDFTYKYPYAEVIAKRMSIVYSHTHLTEYKLLALKVILKISVAANRYAAMDIFNGILLGIDDIDEGRTTSVLLREEIEDYSKLIRNSQNVSIDYLHHSLRAVRREAESRLNVEEIREATNDIDLSYNVNF